MPEVHIKNNRIEFRFSFEQKYLFIRGDSGVGKTSLVNLVESFNTNAEAVDCLGYSKIAVLHAEAELTQEGFIFFLDENNVLLKSNTIASKLNDSNNYFVIISRDRNYDFLKTGLDSLVDMRVDTNGIHVIEQIYPRKEHLDQVGSCIVCEDSKAGKQFLELVLEQTIESAQSSKNFGKKLRKLARQSYTIVYDRCGISFAYEDQMSYLQARGINVVSELDWDSFESYVLESPEYGYRVPWYPDKEMNASKMFRDLICTDYDKSILPEDIKLPVYWKLAELKSMLGKMKLF